MKDWTIIRRKGPGGIRGENNLANNNRAHRLAVMAIALDIITFALGIGFIFVAIGHDAGGTLECTSVNGLCKTTHDTTPLGTWSNMPSAATELMGNTSYRSMLVPSNTGGFLTGVRVLLTVGCITASNTVGAQLQLQYAIWSTSSQTNTTNYQSVAGAVHIDGTTLPGCLAAAPAPQPGSGQDGALNTTANQQGYIFRVIGSGGGGSGDNPRFTFVNIIIEQQQERIRSVIINARSATSFTAVVAVNIAQVASTVENFDWIASNSTALVGTDTQHGSNSCTMAVGAFLCSVVTTFTTPFIGVPSVVASSRNSVTTVTLETGVISLLLAQTLTV